MLRIMNFVAETFFIVFAGFTLVGCGSSGSEPDTTDGPGVDVEPVAGQMPEAGARSLSCEEHEKQTDALATVALLDIMTYPAYGEFLESFLETTSPPGLTFAGFTINAGSQFSLQADVVAKLCDYEAFAQDICLTTPSSGSIENGVLSVTWLNADNSGGSTSLTVNDDTYSSGQLVTTEADGSVGTSVWSRESDGAESFDYSNTDGTAVEFRELPDCSGTAKLTTVENTVVTRITTTAWTSPAESDFNLSWETCDQRSGDPVCESF